MSARHINIPIFIPHLGCPNNCVFCNQRSISGHTDFVKENVRTEIETTLSTISEDDNIEAEIAFFGGSFTGIDRELMIYLLDVAYEYVKCGRVESIRLSTRPDYIDDEILDILGGYGVKTIELGLQSMDDSVLLASKRGHTREVAERACLKVKEHGFSLIGQMMIGLPRSDIEKEIFTAKEICRLGADGARIYPTVVFYDTELCEMARKGEYTPLEDEDATIRTKEVLKIFDSNDVPCIRIGLCASENLSSADKVFGGANHAAVGELAMGELFFDKICEALDVAENKNKCDTLVIYVPKGATSKAIGQKKRNIQRIKDKYFVNLGINNVRVIEKNQLLRYNIMIDFLNFRR